MPETLSLEVDCHAYAWHEHDPEYPETGPENLVRMAEEFGVLVAHLPEHPYSRWAWWYRIIGPAEHIEKLLLAEYCGPDEELAREMVESAQPWDGRR